MDADHRAGAGCPVFVPGATQCGLGGVCPDHNKWAVRISAGNLPGGQRQLFIRSECWRVLLSAEKAMPRRQVFWATMVGYAGNAYLPAWAGEVLRSVMLAKKNQISISFSSWRRL